MIIHLVGELIKKDNVRWVYKNESILIIKRSIIARFIRTLKNKIFTHMAAVSKNVYFDVLDDIYFMFVDKYTNAYHRTIKMKPIDVNPDSYAE